MIGILVTFAIWSLVSAQDRQKFISEQEYFDAVNQNNSPVELHIDTRNVQARNKTAPYLYGLMFEDISHSGDGGIYGELLINRAFHGKFSTLPNLTNFVGSSVKGNMKLPLNHDLTGWKISGPCQFEIDKSNPISKALPAVAKVTVVAGASGECAISNSGWWGIDVSPQTYSNSFFVKSTAGKRTRFTVSLETANRRQVWAQANVEERVPNDRFIEIKTKIQNEQKAPNTNNIFVLKFDVAEFAGHAIYFGLISLFGETFKNRKNGLRKDLGEAFYDLKPKFLRFPGGNNLEGISIDTRWKWYETVGPLKDRPGRPGNWGYYNTDGLGLLEYLEWCEDMEMEPVLAVYAGYSLGGRRDMTEDEMRFALQEALDELEYCMGSTSTRFGAMRAAHGHPNPFRIKFIEIGNEDWFSKTYRYRWRIMYNGLKDRYPNITYISTIYNENGNHMNLPPGTVWDTHHYEEPRYFLKNFNFYDNWNHNEHQPGVGVLLGEYSVYQVDTPSGKIDFGNPPDKHVKYPRLLSAIAEGVYALGGERNPHTVWMSSYAPSLQRIEATNWTPNMILFNSDQSQTVKSASYWQQWMFSRYRGTHTIPVRHRGNFNPLFWASSIDIHTNKIYVKVINAGAESVPLSIKFDIQVNRVNGTILTSGDVNDYNFFDNRYKVIPKPIDSLRVENGLDWKVPRWSINIFEFSP